ncbi:MAG: hypothetical protein JOY90_25020 [Bradyrhizobium sp.]|uniref:hypothetical protein n=1 Tax=Bradyrhizobium sp. TaxID=376 RepID=UPI001DD854E9|nr:hypothetical protein [Bradyrhizobium sp.]MBV9563676.1 hypothetical protein [Bradyrhizobium sp.]
MSRHLNVRLPAASLPADTGGPPPRATIGLPSCAPHGGVNTKWSGNSCAVHPTKRCAPRAGIGIDWLSNKCAALHEEPTRAALPSAGQLPSANLQFVSLTVQAANDAAPSHVVAELGWGVALVLGAVFALGWARRPLTRALALVRQWAARGRHLRIAARPAVAAVADPVGMVPAGAPARGPVPTSPSAALVSDGKVNALLDELGSDDETATRALRQLYARGGWLKWEELLPQDVPVELRDKLVKICRTINRTLALDEARAALAQARQMLNMHRVAWQPAPA